MTYALLDVHSASDGVSRQSGARGQKVPFHYYGGRYGTGDWYPRSLDVAAASDGLDAPVSSIEHVAQDLVLVQRVFTPPPETSGPTPPTGATRLDSQGSLQRPKSAERLTFSCPDLKRAESAESAER